jgi:hypothetical protein
MPISFFTAHHRIGGNSVDTAACKKQRYQREGPEQPRGKSVVAHPVADQIGHRCHVGDGQIGVDRLYFTLHSVQPIDLDCETEVASARWRSQC